MKTKAQSIYEELKRLILEGKFKPNEKLPSKRKLAYASQVSIFTVQHAYDQLLAEGYIHTKEKVGYFVNEGIIQIKPSTLIQVISTTFEDHVKYTYSFKTNVVDNTLFPLSTWTKLSREVLSSDIYPLLNLTPPQGILELRMEIVKYLDIYRNIQVSPEQIVIGSGSQPLLNLIVEILGRDSIYAIENPGYPRIYQTLKGLGVSIEPIGVDEQGLSIEALTKTNASIVHLTPAHQFPTGIVMPVQRRLALLQWAIKENHYIIEDDYDSEFRYGGAPVSSLFGLTEQSKVIYMNTFTKSLGPAFKMGYIVLPKALLPKYQALKNHHSCTVPNFEQYILYKFMKEGYFDRHLNKTRQIYRKKLLIIQNLIESYPHLSIQGDEAGLHFILTIDTNILEKELIDRLKQKSIEVRGLHDFSIKHLPTHKPKLVIGYSGIPLNDIEKAIKYLFLTINEVILA